MSPEEYREDLKRRKQYNLGLAIITLQEYCKDHPTCEKCKFWEVHKGCTFRGKSPREW